MGSQRKCGQIMSASDFHSEQDEEAMESFENKSDMVRLCSSRIGMEICIENSQS